MAKAVGVDLGSHSAKVALLEGGTRAVRLVSFVLEPLPQTEEEGTAAARLQTLFRQRKLPRDPVVLGLDAHAAIVRELAVPFRNPDQIRKIIKYESEGHLFSFDIEEVLVDFVKVRERPDGSELIVLAYLKRLLAERLQVLQEAGLDPVEADLDVLGIYNALTLTPHLEEHRTLAVVDIGYQAVRILVVADGRPARVRGFRGGCASVVSALREEAGLALPEAQARVVAMLPPPQAAGTAEPAEEMVLVEEEGGLETPDIERPPEELEREFLADQLARLRRKIVREVQRTLATLVAEEPVGLVLLTGGGSRTPGLADALAESVDAPVKPLEILPYLDHSLPPEEAARVEPFLPAAVGLALKGLGRDATGTNFRREEYAFQKRFEQIKVPLTVCLSLLLLFLSLVAYRFRLQKRARGREYDALVWHVVHAGANLLKLPEFALYVDRGRKGPGGYPAVVLTRVSRDRFSRHRRLAAKLKRLRLAAQREMGKISEKEEEHCALDTWAEFFRRLEEAQRRFGYDTSPILPFLRIDQDGVECHLILRDYDKEFPLIQEAFRKSPLLRMERPRANDPIDVEGPNPRILKHLRFNFAKGKE